ncbi:unnamed protein product [Spodoptera exigua]|nr:unnamed protein product [Spodoptera exigua]
MHYLLRCSMSCLGWIAASGYWYAFARSVSSSDFDVNDAQPRSYDSEFANDDHQLVFGIYSSRPVHSHSTPSLGFGANDAQLHSYVSGFADAVYQSVFEIDSSCPGHLNR